MDGAVAATLCALAKQGFLIVREFVRRIFGPSGYITDPHYLSHMSQRNSRQSIS
ncbi:hypothetical protein LMG29739_05682 [Paraburkholderia solisilvae]|uniref:Uncharacterized protein n=1 Tax=Paraburkholderia solisilvae TaxID=624376 RepID=A0A6J5EVI3_9BURK|nr:hypothetical protein LMG29739_05682 [Paraburkholderia solisilvae]